MFKSAHCFRLYFSVFLYIFSQRFGNVGTVFLYLSLNVVLHVCAGCCGGGVGGRVQPIQDPHHRHSARLPGRGTPATIYIITKPGSGFLDPWLSKVRISYENLRIPRFFPFVFFLNSYFGNVDGQNIYCIWATWKQ
jgi:hypothetical protein